MRGYLAPSFALSLVLVLGCSRNSAPPSPAAHEGALPASANPGINDRYATADGRAAMIRGLDSPERAAFQKPEAVLALLDLKAGEAVGDVGAGPGYMTLALSKAVGPSGKVYAEDITPGFLDEVRAKIASEKLQNVDVVLGTATDAKLPAACCDVIFVLDAYHHFEWPQPMLASIKTALKPRGRFIIIEFHRRSNPMFEKSGIDYAKHIPLDDSQVVAQIEKLGWTTVSKNDFTPYQYVAVFTPK